MALSQDNRLIRIATPLGEGTLIVLSFSGVEYMSKDFSFSMELASEKNDVTFEQLAGQNVTVGLSSSDGTERHINGIIVEFVAMETAVKDGLSKYSAVMVPAFSLLKGCVDCRIFQDKSTPDIIKEVLGAGSLKAKGVTVSGCGSEAKLDLGEPSVWPEDKVDYLIHSAGFLQRGSLTEKDLARRMFNVNFFSVCSIFENIHRYLKPRGKFLLIGSSAWRHGRNGFSAYASSKSAMISLAQAASEEYPDYRVNVLNPKRVVGRMRKKVFGQEDEALMATPEQVANAAIKVLSIDQTGLVFEI